MLNRRAFLAGGLALAASPLRTPARAQPADPSVAAQAFIDAYPQAIVGYANGDLVFASGARVALDDGRDKDFDRRLENADPQDMLHDPYPWGAADDPPARNFDPGRYRCDPLFRALYGESRDAVAAQLETVTWLANTRPSPLPVHRAFDVPARVARISAKLEALGEAFLPYLAEPAGSFNWRVIAGTDRLSAHSFAVAIDINVNFADYWRWAGGGPDPSEYRNRIPPEIVAAFETEDFIWGGRWYHYDTMHFEYRPELRTYADLSGR
ncbi:MAG: M15 family metallopeptidase [Alphaproteobacteria bacterium]